MAINLKKLANNMCSFVYGYIILVVSCSQLLSPKINFRANIGPACSQWGRRRYHFSGPPNRTDRPCWSGRTTTSRQPNIMCGRKWWMNWSGYSAVVVGQQVMNGNYNASSSEMSGARMGTHCASSPLRLNRNDDTFIFALPLWIMMKTIMFLYFSIKEGR